MDKTRKEVAATLQAGRAGAHKESDIYAPIQYGRLTSATRDCLAHAAGDPSGCSAGRVVFILSEQDGFVDMVDRILSGNKFELLRVALELSPASLSSEILARWYDAWGA